MPTEPSDGGDYSVKVSSLQMIQFVSIWYKLASHHMSFPKRRITNHTRIKFEMTKNYRRKEFFPSCSSCVAKEKL